MPADASPGDPRVLALLQQAALLRGAVTLAPDNAKLRQELGLVLLSMQDAPAALTQFDHAVRLDPAFGAAYYYRGVALELLQLGGAEAAYWRALENGFETPEVCGRLATLWHQAGRRDDAAPMYRHAALLAPGTVAALKHGARAALIEGKLAEAETLLRQILAREPTAAAFRADLGYIFRARGDFAAASAELEQALGDAPENVGLYYDLVQTKRVTEADAALVARMRSARDVPALAPSRIKLHLALAKAFDDTGDTNAARIELQAADALRTLHTPFDRAAATAQTDSIIGLFTPHYMAHPRHQGDPSPLPILVIGMPRSGTTLVEQILAGHSEVGGAGEVAFWEAQGRAFVRAADASLGADLRAVAAAYGETLRAAAPGVPHVVDKMPFNFRWAPLVHLALPNARIVHCRRHPADTCLSIMATNMAASPSFSPARADLLLFYRHYQRLVAHGRAVVPPSRWLDLDYEALVETPEPKIRALLAFCGLPWESACLTPERTMRDVLTFSQFQARQKINQASVGRWRRHGDWLAEFASL